jgi:hypothetical protein
MGPSRFTVYAVWRYLFLRRYYGAFSFLPSENEDKIEQFPNLKDNLDTNIYARENGIL